MTPDEQTIKDLRIMLAMLIDALEYANGRREEASRLLDKVIAEARTYLA
jgi:hypothetical protein